MMPPEAAEYRAEQMTLLAGLIHQRRTDPRLGEWLAELAASPLAGESARTSTATPAPRSASSSASTTSGSSCRSRWSRN